MGTIILKSAVKRKPGYLYYIDGSGNICEAKMAIGGKAKAKANKAKQAAKKSKKSKSKK